MNTQNLFFIMYLLFAFAGQSCVTQTEKAVAQKVTLEPPNMKRADLATEGESLIEKNPNLSDDQKIRMRKLWERSRKEIDNLTQRSFELRAVLAKDVIAIDYNQEEVTLIKEKLAKVEQERLSVFFRGVNETNHILGRWGSANERNNFYQWFTIDPTSAAF